jgi:hypothetical protein
VYNYIFSHEKNAFIRVEEKMEEKKAEISVENNIEKDFKDSSLKPEAQEKKENDYIFSHEKNAFIRVEEKKAEIRVEDKISDEKAFKDSMDMLIHDINEHKGNDLDDKSRKELIN